MDMENSSSMENSICMNGNMGMHGNGTEQISTGCKENENLDVDFLEDFDSYFDNINDRLTISRMVSDSVIRGIVNAVEQEATERIAREECEVAKLKETFHLYHVGSDEKDFSGLPFMQNGICSSLSDALVEHEKIKESLGSLRNAAKEQFNSLKNEVAIIRGFGSKKRINSSSDLVGLGGILQGNIFKDGMDMDITLDSLNKTIDTSFKWMDDMVRLSSASLLQWQQECSFKDEIKDMVTTTCVRNLKDDFEEKLWDQKARFCCNESSYWLQKIKEMSSLRLELETISKLLSISELGHLTSHGSLDIVDGGSNKKNGNHGESVITMPEVLDCSQLKHMSKDELMNYFKTEMNKMKREHDYKMHEKTEAYFSLKREYLKEKGSSLPWRKDKEFDVLKRKIPDVILKLDKILIENEKLPAFSSNAGNLGTLKIKLDSLLSENRQLRCLLADKKKELNHLSSLVSDAAEKKSQQSLAEGKLAGTIENLECAYEEARMEAYVREDVYKCVLKEFMGEIKMISDESELKHNVMHEVYEIMMKDIAQKDVPSCKYDIEDACIQSFIMQGLSEVVFREAFKEAEDKLINLNMKYINENETRAFHEMKALENERALRLEVVEKEKFKQKVCVLEAVVEEKDKLVQEGVATAEQYKFACQDLNSLREQICQQQKMIQESSLGSKVLKSDLDDAQKRNKRFEVEIHELKQKLDLAKKELRESTDEKDMLITATLENKKASSILEAKHREQAKEMDSIIALLNGLVQVVDDFECRVTENIIHTKLRLESLFGQLSSLAQKFVIVRRTGFMYKQRFERKHSDLQKAEAEVDLLGDEVDFLSNLLEKIYLTLDHYSPILQHYPGIVEVLKLVRREMRGEYTN